MKEIPKVVNVGTLCKSEGQTRVTAINNEDKLFCYTKSIFIFHQPTIREGNVVELLLPAPVLKAVRVPDRLLSATVVTAGEASTEDSPLHSLATNPTIATPPASLVLFLDQ